MYHGAYFRGDKDAGYVDIVLGSSSGISTGDNGVIMSDPSYSGSDIFLVGNDAVVARIDNNNNGTGNFLVYGENSEELFRVNHSGDVLVKGSTVHGSDRNRKERIVAISNKQILQDILEMPIYEWQYIGQDRRHIGPMAQDFHKAFGLGDDDKSIAAIDADGVALAAIKAQQDIIEKQQVQIEELKKELDDLKIMMVTMAADRKYNPLFDNSFQADLGGFDALKNSGYLGKIQGTRVETDLFKYYRMVDVIKNAEQSLNNFIEEMEYEMWKNDVAQNYLVHRGRLLVIPQLKKI